MPKICCWTEWANSVLPQKSVLGQAQNDPRVAPRPALEGPVSETVELIPVVHDLPFLSVDYDEGHPSRWQRASNDPRGMV